MEVVINKSYGGFGLSEEAIEMCIQRGMTCTVFDEHGDALDKNADFVKRSEAYFDNIYCCLKSCDNEFRFNPILIDVVKEIGVKAGSKFSELKIIDIPFDTAEGWEIHDYDGVEKIVECHRSWS